MKTVFSSKKLKYGGSAVLFSAVFVLFVILINVVISLIASRTGGLYADLTTKQLYTVGEISEEALKDINQNVDIIFCRTRDEIADNDYLNPVLMLAEQYEKKFANVNVVFESRINNPEYFSKFNSRDIDDNSVIVYCEETGLNKVYCGFGYSDSSFISDFYISSDENVFFAFNGEKKLTSAIRSVARKDNEALKAGLVMGHGENVPHNLNHILENYGYEVSEVLLKEISQEELAKYSLLIVYDPIYDFIVNEYSGDSSTEGVINEIEKLSDYVMDDFGNVMFFFDPYSGYDRTKLFELIESRFGVTVNDKFYTTDVTTYNFPSFLGTYDPDTSSDGYAIHSPISKNNKDYLPAFGVSCYMETVSKNDNFSVSPIIITSDKAKVYVGENNFQYIPDVPLMTVSTYSKLINEKEKTARVFVCGSTGFVNELTNASFSNEELFKQCVVSMGNEDIIMDIDFKVLDDTAISVTNSVKKDMRNILVIAIPSAIALVGVVVYIKRKYL